MTPQLDLIGIVTADMGASLAFYRRLGLDIPAGADSEAHVEITLPGGLRLAWDTEDVIRSFTPHWQPPAGGHRIGLAFRCAGADAVDREHAALVAAGYASAVAPFDAFWGQRYAAVHDPDGNAVDLFAPLS
jgi:uncharacterized glyoxalase superfamily protein PhnB